MKILLINLPRDGEVKDFTTPDYYLSDFMQYPPLGLLAISADPHLNENHSITIFDAALKNLSIEETIKYITEFKPDVLGISTVTRRLYSLQEISRGVKQKIPSIKIIAGGPHINAFPMETIELENIDYVLTGYGEKKLPRLIEAIENSADKKVLESIPNLYYKLPNGGIRISPSIEEPIVLDELPFPNRRLVNLNDYYTAADRVKMTTLYTSRGCPFKCIFCDVQEKRFHYRTPPKIVDEFEEIVKLGINEIHIFDDTFNIMRQRVIDMCHEILKRGLEVRWTTRVRVFPFDREMMELMKKAGCVRLHVGVESLDPDILEFMGKKINLEQIKNFFKLCKEFGVDTLAYFIIGFPNETKEYRANLYKEIIKLGPTYAYLNILFPAPKTKYYQMLLNDRTYKTDFWADFVKNPQKDFEIPLPRSRELQRELEAIANEFASKFFLRPRFILREAKRSIFYPKMFFLKAKIFFSFIQKTRKGQGESHNRREI